MAATLASGPMPAHAVGPNAAVLLAAENRPLLEALGGVSARPSAQIPARHRVKIPSEVTRAMGFAELTALSYRYPGTTYEVAGPLHPLLDRAAAAVGHPRVRGVVGPTGRGVFVAVVDTGFDLAHPDLRDARGRTRVRWALDLTRPPVGVYTALESRFGVHDSRGNILRGAVLDAAMIDQALEAGRSPIEDSEGHGTHVASLAAGSPPGGTFVGMAPEASLIVVRAAGGSYPDLTADALEAAAAFAFERADHEHTACVLNISIGTDFGPHDGSLAWEKAIAEHVGDAKPGHAIVVAAGNSGRLSSGVHQVAALTERELEVPIVLGGATQGPLRVWATSSPGTTLRIGVRVADASLSIAPVARGIARTRKGDALQTAVLHGGAASEEIPGESSSAIVLVAGRFGAAPPRIVVAGEGQVGLWLDAAALPARGRVGFRASVREGTVCEPAVHPALLAVGATVARPAWSSAAGLGPYPFLRELLDPAGGVAAEPTEWGPAVDGDVADFSGLGPNVANDPRPDILAPGVAVAGAMASTAGPTGSGSMFAATCVAANGVLDGRCLVADGAHGFGFGTSMAAPLASGAVALLFELAPTLTAPKLRDLLRSSAHRPRAGNPSQASAFPGELDVGAALRLLGAEVARCAPDARAGWLVASRDFVAATGGEGVRVLVQARCADGSPFVPPPGDAPALRVWAVRGDGTLAPSRRRDDGTFAFDAQEARAGTRLEVHAAYGEIQVAEPIVLPIGMGPWDARYGVSVAPSCAIPHVIGRARTVEPFTKRDTFLIACLALAFAARRRRHASSVAVKSTRRSLRRRRWARP